MTTTKAAPWPRQGIFKLPDLGGWMVPSRSTRGAYWHVNWGQDLPGGIWWSCTCPAGRERLHMSDHRDDLANACRHVRQVATAEAADGYPPLKAGTIHPERFVD